MRPSHPRGVPKGSYLVTTAVAGNHGHCRDLERYGLLPACLDSILDQTLSPTDYEVVVVDNASDDGTLEFLDRHYPRVRVVRSATNRGFAGGCAQGLAATDAPVAVLLNNDAVRSAGLPRAPR